MKQLFLAKAVPQPCRNALNARYFMFWLINLWILQLVEIRSQRSSLLKDGNLIFDINNVNAF